MILLGRVIVAYICMFWSLVAFKNVFFSIVKSSLLLLESGSTCRDSYFQPTCYVHNTKGYITMTGATWTHGCLYTSNTYTSSYDELSTMQNYCNNHYDCSEQISGGNMAQNCYVHYYTQHSYYLQRSYIEYYTAW